MSKIEKSRIPLKIDPHFQLLTQVNLKEKKL